MNSLSRRTLLTLLILLPLAGAAFGTPAASQPPGGTLAYVKNGAVYVAPAAGGAEKRVPQSDGAVKVTLSADGKSFQFWRTPASAQTKDQDPLADEYAFLPDTGEVRPTGTPRKKRSALQDRYEEGQHAAPVISPSGVKVWAQAADYTDIRAYRQVPGAAPEKITLLGAKRPEPLFDALRRARRPKNIKDLTDNYKLGFWKEAQNWSSGGPAVSHDGKTVFFASNAGGTMGASGNTTFGLFAGDIATRRLSVLSKAGTFFGRVPHISRVSPNGKRWMFVSSAHNMAIDNPCYVYVVDLETQAVRELVYSVDTTRRKRLTNLVDGACWSPDGRFVAVSVFFYDVPRYLRDNSADDLYNAASKYTLEIYDAATGKRVRSIPGATQPVWAR